jgi:hypothetical protein
MLTRRIIFRPLDRSDCALTGDPAVYLRPDLVGGSFLKRIGAPSRQQKNRGQ